MENLNNPQTANAFNRKATANTGTFLGPLQTLVNGNEWVGDTGFNLMVVPNPNPESLGFIVLISQLFETDVFTAVPAPVPNRSLNNGTEQIGAVKYSQKVAENVSKNILHEETGMWLNQTLGTLVTDPTGNGLEMVNGTLDGQPASNYVLTNPVIRSGTVPHGNTFQAAGVWNNYPFQQPISGDISKYIQLSNFPTVNGNLSFLPTYADGSNPADLQAAYITQLQKALTIMGIDPNTYENFINPIGFLNKYANNITNIDALPITTANNMGAVLNIPFERAVVGPQEFVCTFMIETIQNAPLDAPLTDQNPSYFQIQYLQSIPLLFPNGFKGKAVIFPHWNVNTVIAI